MKGIKDILAKTITMTIINIIALIIISYILCDLEMKFMDVFGIMYVLVFTGAYIMIMRDGIKNAVISSITCSLISTVLIMGSLFIIKPNGFAGIIAVSVVLAAFIIDISVIVICSITYIIIKNIKNKREIKQKD